VTDHLGADPSYINFRDMQAFFSGFQFMRPQ
jgi:hypothetical protein